MNWAAISAVASCVSVFGIFAFFFQAGRLVGKIEKLEERVNNIDRYGCRHATIIHRREDDNEDL